MIARLKDITTITNKNNKYNENKDDDNDNNYDKNNKTICKEHVKCKLYYKSSYELLNKLTEKKKIRKKEVLRIKREKKRKEKVYERSYSNR